ncbi:MAG: LysR family transcriptional regulator [Mailhella sp.]|nr:LysR family transcriptional regulator [Mailhella sp.]
MNWTIEQLRAFVAAAEQGSFSAAGRALGRAQSVVSTHVAMLEDTLGVELFDRSARSPVLTEAGKDMLQEARNVLRQCQRFDARAIAEFKGEASRFNVSISHGVPFQGVSETIAAMSERFPFLGGTFQIFPGEQVWRRVGKGEDHVGIVLGEEPRMGENCEMLCLGQMRYCVVASRKSPLAAQKTVRQQDLAHYRQILFSEENSRYIVSPTFWVVNDVLCAVYWAALGVGWTAIPLTLAKRIAHDASMRDLVILDMDRVSFPVGNVYLLWNTEFKRREVVEFFRSDLRKRYGMLGGSGNGFF